MKDNYIGERITSLRMAMDISEYTLSRRIGKCNNYINKISSGAINPSFNTLLAICDFFGITLSEFFDEEAQKQSPTAVTITSRLPKLTENQLQTLLAVIDSMKEEDN